MCYKIIETKEKDFDYLYKQSALTFEGCALDEENLKFLEKWLKDCGAQPKECIRIYNTKGSKMNRHYGLSFFNSYQEDLNIISIPLEDLQNPPALFAKRFELGGRWFDDVVDNNQRREEGECL